MIFIEQLMIFNKKEGKMTNKKDDIKTEDIIISDKKQSKDFDTHA